VAVEEPVGPDEVAVEMSAHLVRRSERQEGLLAGFVLDDLGAEQECRAYRELLAQGHHALRKSLSDRTEGRRVGN
jgi:hypothetical protein